MSTMSAEAELQRKNERLELLLNLTTAIASSLDLREVLRAIAANIRAVMHADAVTVWLPDAASGKFKVFALDFPHGKGVIKEEFLVTLSAGAKKAMATLKPVVVDTGHRDEFASATSELATAEGIKALCSIPLVNRGRVIGILSAGRTTETPFIAEDVDFFSQASGLIAIAIENALAYEELREREAKIRRLVDANIVGICIWNVEGGIINTNDAFLKMLGYDRELFESTSMRWTEMTPPEWLRSFARTWTTDLKSRHIRVNAISPGSIDTPGLNDRLASAKAGEERKKMISTATPLGRLGTPDEIAKAVVFLASEDSSYITGIELFVDGGFAQV